MSIRCTTRGSSGAESCSCLRTENECPVLWRIRYSPNFKGTSHVMTGQISCTSLCWSTEQKVSQSCFFFFCKNSLSAQGFFFFSKELSVWNLSFSTQYRCSSTRRGSSQEESPARHRPVSDEIHWSNQLFLHHHKYAKQILFIHPPSWKFLWTHLFQISLHFIWNVTAWVGIVSSDVQHWVWGQQTARSSRVSTKLKAVCSGSFGEACSSTAIVPNRIGVVGQLQFMTIRWYSSFWLLMYRTAHITSETNLLQIATCKGNSWMWCWFLPKFDKFFWELHP